MAAPHPTKSPHRQQGAPAAQLRLASSRSCAEAAAVQVPASLASAAAAAATPAAAAAPRAPLVQKAKLGARGRGDISNQGTSLAAAASDAHILSVNNSRGKEQHNIGARSNTTLVTRCGSHLPSRRSPHTPLMVRSRASMAAARTCGLPERSTSITCAKKTPHRSCVHTQKAAGGVAVKCSSQASSAKGIMANGGQVGGIATQSAHPAHAAPINAVPPHLYPE